MKEEAGSKVLKERDQNAEIGLSEESWDFQGGVYSCKQWLEGGDRTQQQEILERFYNPEVNHHSVCQHHGLSTSCQLIEYQGVGWSKV